MTSENKLFSKKDYNTIYLQFIYPMLPALSSGPLARTKEILSFCRNCMMAIYVTDSLSRSASLYSIASCLRQAHAAFHADWSTIVVVMHGSRTCTMAL